MNHIPPSIFQNRVWLPSYWVGVESLCIMGESTHKYKFFFKNLICKLKPWSWHSTPAEFTKGSLCKARCNECSLVSPRGSAALSLWHLLTDGAPQTSISTLLPWEHTKNPDTDLNSSLCLKYQGRHAGEVFSHRTTAKHFPTHIFILLQLLWPRPKAFPGDQRTAECSEHTDH